VVYSLSDACWLYALMSTIALIWKNQAGRQAKLWFFLAALAGPLHECLQGAGLVAGTFDVLDLVAYFLAALIATAIHVVRPARVRQAARRSRSSPP
jgi:hypothetical protein